jgi:hypothetical protein
MVRGHRLRTSGYFGHVPSVERFGCVFEVVPGFGFGGFGAALTLFEIGAPAINQFWRSRIYPGH